ncbi:MAG: protein-L-isoaspartate(D-aspartate) O-methyltransferase [Acidobacteriota bacterium]
MKPSKINWEKLRIEMVKEQIESRGVKDKRVIEIMKKIPRHLFVSEEYLHLAYEDQPLPIGEEQTISQPYIVAYMTEKLNLEGDEKVLEVGTGSGYQTAILAEMAKEVYTIEVIEFLSLKAQKILEPFGYKNIFFKIGDGTMGWPEYSPFKRILVTAAPSKIPKTLIDQLGENGIMIIPVGTYLQNLVMVRKKGKSHTEETLLPVRFVPLISVH